MSSARDLGEVRALAWITRRAKYGPQGHSGSYSRAATCGYCEGMMALLIKLHAEGVLSEGQVSRATGLHRIDIRRRVDEGRS